uniref:Uncharacterized protein n=1 Tax=Solanum tuberosum TaxID=4113 RepID=M1BD65_SOLTU
MQNSRQASFHHVLYVFIVWGVVNLHPQVLVVPAVVVEVSLLYMSELNKFDQQLV